MEDKRLDKIMKWAKKPYKKLPLELPENIQKLADDGYINLDSNKMTVMDVYCLVILQERLKKGDLTLLEQLVGKAGIRPPKEEKDDLRDIVPDQEKLLERYKAQKKIQ